ncbi:hypothetical protein AOQ84DRAFT_355283 [Glonium stellatum]|uniref:Uncharacterized protein n=1 Tax=Glonium stellatum TaxID=574774 RepID=A0A8E2EXQ1_9PEZI|nr:hypothetical protein AOQ84DRAFT_355283 [Glonium stellatum]
MGGGGTDYAIAPGWIILLVMLGAGFCVCIGYAITRVILGNKEDGIPRNNEQDLYMRQVRQRTLRDLERDLFGARLKRGPGSGQRTGTRG